MDTALSGAESRRLVQEDPCWADGPTRQPLWRDLQGQVCRWRLRMQAREMVRGYYVEAALAPLVHLLPRISGFPHFLQLLAETKMYVLVDCRIRHDVAPRF